MLIPPYHVRDFFSLFVSLWAKGHGFSRDISLAILQKA